MANDNKINIKLEVCRDKNSGKLTIMAHFDAKSPNILIDKNEYIWIPTVEEKDLINEAFNFIPKSDKLNSPKPVENKIDIDEKEKNEIDTKTELESQIEIKKEEEIKTPSEKIKEEIENKIQEHKQDEAKNNLENNDSPEPAVFEITTETIPAQKTDIKEPVKQEIKEDSNELVKDLPKQEPDELPKQEPEELAKQEPIKEDMDVKIQIKEDEENSKQSPQDSINNNDSDKKQKEVEEGIIVEADAEAIEEAIKRHVGKDEEDDSIVEVDEQTIIDKVLSQKKKGKWSKKK